jgi:hypothetical protein
MKNFKIARNLWLIAGFCFLLSLILNIGINKSVLLPVLNGITCILMFINAYISNKKIIKETKYKD